MWFFRLSVESNVADSGYFVTLTYSPEHLPSSGHVEKRDCQLFIKRFRKYFAQRPDTASFRFKYFLVSEYGETFGRPHYHMLIFGNSSQRSHIVQALKECWKLCDPEMFDFPSAVAPITPASINYVCKYTLNNLVIDDYDKRTFLLCSKGIGRDFLTPLMLDYLRKRIDGLAMVNGVRMPLPRYYRDEVYDDDMKFQMRIKQLEQYEQNVEKYFEDNYNSDRQRVESLWRQELNHKAKIIRSKLKTFE